MTNIFELLKHRNFTFLWAGHTVSRLGDWVLMAALPVWVYQITGSATILGAMVIFETLPLLTVGPVAGVFVDRWDRRRVMMLADLLRGLAVLLLFLVRSPEFVPLIFLVGFLDSALGRFVIPAREAALPDLVPEESLMTANSLFAATLQGTRLIGPALGGALIGLAGPQVAFVLDAASFFVAALSVAAIRLPQRPAAAQEGLIGVYRDLLDGVWVIRRNLVLSSVLGVWCVLMLSAGAIYALLVVFVRQALGGSAASYGYLLSIQGLGMAAGAVLSGVLGTRLSPTTAFKGGLLLFGPLFLAGANAPDVHRAAVLVFGMGAMMAVVAIADTTIFQWETPERYRGRVLASNEALASTMLLVSAGLAGFLSDLMGVRAVFNAGAWLSIAAALLAVVLLRRSRVHLTLDTGHFTDT